MAARPPLIYLEASVLLSYVIGMPGRVNVVQSVLEDAESGKIHVLTSTLSIAEVAYVLPSQGLGNTASNEASIDELWTPASPIRLADVSLVVVREARSIIRQANLNQTKRVRSVDAVHLATAEIHDCDHFFTYEGQSTRTGWDSLIKPHVSEPYVNAPRLPGLGA